MRAPWVLCGEAILTAWPFFRKAKSSGPGWKVDPVPSREEALPQLTDWDKAWLYGRGCFLQKTFLNSQSARIEQ